MSKKRKNKGFKKVTLPIEQNKMLPRDAYDLCDSMDLPDGAFWAMVEELSGATPDEFVED